jgi:glycine cleavage system H lipoate-binding protein
MGAQIDFLSSSKLEYPRGVERMAFMDHSPDTRSERYNFLDQAWLQVDRGVVVRTGGFLSSHQGRDIRRVQLPEVGDMVYRGLPLAALVSPTGSKSFIPSPVTGRILEVNRHLVGHANYLWQDPCHQGWIALVQPTELFRDMLATRKRTVVLAGINRRPNQELQHRLTYLGCRTIALRSLDHVFQVIRDNRSQVLVLDAGTQDRNIASVLKWFSFTAPEVKIILAGSPGVAEEAASFANHAVHYPLEPFNDTSITDTLHACFQPVARSTRNIDPSSARPKQLQRFRVSRGWNLWVSLIASGQVLRQHEGLERELFRIAGEHDCIIETSPGSSQTFHAEIEREAVRSVRVLVLNSEDQGRIPGSLIIQAPADLKQTAGSRGTVVNLQVQSASLGFQHRMFDPQTTHALAEHLFTEISYDLGLSPTAAPEQISPSQVH